MPQGGYTETIADAGLIELRLQDLLQIAQLASRLVRKANCPLSSFLRNFHDFAGAVQRLVDQGHKDVVVDALAKILPPFLELAQAWGFEDQALSFQEELLQLTMSRK
ncbi:hypothetical protein [Streptomyces sp. NPDC007369]|uniref:hypothetical protein n=1 Tax=Streptomyces sp. NPDC007369 TaxID=3154589 RepID=UPI0033E5F682